MTRRLWWLMLAVLVALVGAGVPGLRGHAAETGAGDALDGVLKRALKFDAERDFAKIRARALYVLSRTDKLFPPAIAPAVMDRLSRAGVEATYVEIDSDFGHLASGSDWAKWAPALRDFLARLHR